MAYRHWEEELISSLNDAGIIVDVSHAAKSTMMQAADLSRVPVIASHSGIKQLMIIPETLMMSSY